MGMTLSSTYVLVELSFEKYGYPTEGSRSMSEGTNLGSEVFIYYNYIFNLGVWGLGPQENSRNSELIFY